MGALGPEQRLEPRYKVAHHTYLASGRRLSYTLSVECVVDCQYVKHSLLVRQIFVTCSREKRYQALPAFPYCKRRKAGQGLGTRLICHTSFHKSACRVPVQTEDRKEHVVKVNKDGYSKALAASSEVSLKDDTYGR